MTAHIGTLEITLPSDREVRMTRDFDAPRTLVFEAHTKPDLLERWLTAPGRTLQICEINLAIGGAFRFVWRGDGKRDVGMFGIYREIVPPERFVRTEAWEDWDAGESVVTTVLDEEDGKTKLTSTVLFPSREVRDQVVKSGLERGAAEGFDKLAELLAQIAA